MEKKRIVIFRLFCFVQQSDWFWYCPAIYVVLTWIIIWLEFSYQCERVALARFFLPALFNAQIIIHWLLSLALFFRLLSLFPIATLNKTHSRTRKLSGKEEENNVKQPSHSLAVDIVCSACLIAPNWTGRAYWFCTTEHTFRIIIKHLQNHSSFTNWIHRINPVFFLSTHTHTHTESHLTLYGSALKPWHFITKTNLRDSKRKR